LKLYFASGNDHKKTEMSRLLGGFELTLPKEEGISFDPDENGSTFIDNAVIKAKALYDIVHAPVLADDSGLCVDALGGKPGIHTARYGEEEAGRKLSAEEKYMLLLKNMEGITNRRAEFVCAICLYLSPTRIYVIQETSEGSITLTPSNGSGGFGYDPVFYNNEAGRIVAELPEGEKDLYSHRGKAARIMKTLIEKELNI
jgi:XTP/dITP diphosphohydrolase